jgi:hypothetical protein
MSSHTRRVRFLLPLVTGIIALAGALPAYASTYEASTIVPGQDHPLAPCAPGTGVNYPGAEVEPYVDVDRPSNKQHIVAVYQQDRWTNGGGNGLWTSVSHDFGNTWTAVTAAPAFSRCTGGTAVGNDYERASDPWVSIAPNGDVYQIAIAFDVSGPAFGGPSAVLVSKSTNHGDSWDVPKGVIRDSSPNVLNDKESITADPNTSNNVYAVWDRLISPGNTTMASTTGFENAVSFRGPAWFSRTTNAGASWEPPRIIFDPGEINQTIGNQIWVTPSSPTASGVPGGELLDGFLLINNVKNAHHLRGRHVAVLRSLDHGVSWSGPTTVDRLVTAEVCFAFDCSTPATRVRTGDIIPEFAVDRKTGYYYATWQDARFTGHAQVAFSMSKDGGRSWSPTIRINPASETMQSFTPMVHVADDGTVGVAYYRLEDPTSTSNVYFVHCHQSGPGLAGAQDCSQASSWSSSVKVAGPFDMAQAPIARGHFVGDYFGLTDAGSAGFRPFYDLATAANQTDNFTNTVCPDSGC